MVGFLLGVLVTLLAVVALGIWAFRTSEPRDVSRVQAEQFMAEWEVQRVGAQAREAMRRAAGETNRLVPLEPFEP